jgi:hypothetical protein
MLRSAGVVGFLMIVPAVVACGSDDEEAKPPSSNVGVAPNADGTCPADHPVLNAQQRCLDQASGTASCMAEAAKNAPGVKVDDPTCSAGCTCTYCATAMFQCGTDPECTQILQCAQENNCSGTECYTRPPPGSPAGTHGVCQDLIDSTGNGAGISSNAVALVQVVDACARRVKFGTLPETDFSTREGPNCPSACP